MSKFTPGKWTARCRSASDGSLVVMNELFDEICEIREKAYRVYGERNDVDMTNAALIASAPDLYAALSELIAERENDFHHDTEGFNMARAALAKADGK